MPNDDPMQSGWNGESKVVGLFHLPSGWRLYHQRGKAASSVRGVDEEKGSGYGEMVERERRGWRALRTARDERREMEGAPPAVGVASCGGGDAELRSGEQRGGILHHIRDQQDLKRHGVPPVR